MKAREGRRVVVTGMGGLCALGGGWGGGRRAPRRPLRRRHRARARRHRGAEHALGAPVRLRAAGRVAAQDVRSMGRVALLAARATELALEDAGLPASPLLRDGRRASPTAPRQGSPRDRELRARVRRRRSAKGVTPTEYIRSHEPHLRREPRAFFGVRGRIVPTPCACTSGSQAIGYGYEAIRFGRAERMICGGAEELHPIHAAVFDLLFAASTRNDAPDATPRPFDAERDGLVVGEGAATLVLEELASARARGAHILAEILGYGTNCDGGHMTAPDVDGMEAVMRLASPTRASPRPTSAT